MRTTANVTVNMFVKKTFAEICIKFFDRSTSAHLKTNHVLNTDEDDRQLTLTASPPSLNFVTVTDL